MSLIIEQIKNLLLIPNSRSFTPTSPTSPTSTSPITSFNTPEIFQEIENADNVFVLIEEIEIQENEVTVNNNNQTQNKLDLNKPFENKDILDYTWGRNLLRVKAESESPKPKTETLPKPETPAETETLAEMSETG